MMARMTMDDPFLDRPDLLDIVTHLVDLLTPVDRTALGDYLLTQPHPGAISDTVPVLDSASLALNVLAATHE